MLNASHSFIRKLFLTLCCSTFMFSCSEEPLDEYSILDSLRVLDIQVSTPETNQFDSIVSFNVTPVVSDFEGTNPISVKINICLDPGIDFGKDAVCSGALIVDTSEAAPATSRTGALTTRSVPYNMSSLVFSNFSATSQYNGVPVILTLEISNGTETVKSFKRILYTNKTTLNANPTISDVLVNGSAWSGLPTGKSELSAQSSVAESFSYKTSEGDIINSTESLQVTWFATGKEFSRNRTLEDETTEWSPPQNTGALVGIIRDGRGGSSMVIKSF